MMQHPSSEEARPRRSQEEAAQLAAAFERSGLTRGEFCRQHGLSTGTLDSYRKRHGQSCKAALAPSRFIPVELAHQGKAPASGLAVAMPNGYRIEVSREFDAHTLRHLVAALETA
jgi:transposase-like protein